MLSFILPTRNRPERLSRTLAQLGSLALRADQAEVIVADNASTPAVCAPGGGAEGVLENGVRVRVLRLDTNFGAAARNHAAAASDPRAQWLVMLDDDSYPVHTGFLDALAQADGHTAAVQAEIFVPASRGTADGPGCRTAAPPAPSPTCPTPTHTSHSSHTSLVTPPAPTLSQPPHPVDPTLRCSAGEDTPRQHGRSRESGGLPEVFIGCGVAIRRHVFLALGGYDAAFDYYAEEYDLAARILLSGGRVTLDRRFQVLHEKTTSNRSMNRILRRLVRNNVYVALRYSPRGVRTSDVRRHFSRYARIAVREGAAAGYALGIADLVRTSWAQKRTEMTLAVYERFTGLAAARSALGAAWLRERFTQAVLIGEGKNGHVVRQALDELGVRVTASVSATDPLVRALPPGVAAVVGTLSPGPMLDAMESAQEWAADARVIVPWEISSQGSEALRGVFGPGAGSLDQRERAA